MASVWYAAAPHLPPGLRRDIFRMARPRRYEELRELREMPVTSKDSYSLRPYIERQAIFIHIPKCAGITVAGSIFGCRGGGHLRNLQYRMAFDENEYRNFFKFTFVRNPWDRLVSAYYFLRDGGINWKDEKRAAASVQRFPTFESFVLDYIGGEDFRSVLHFVPQYEFLRMDGQSVDVDYIGRFESFQEDFDAICKRIGVANRLTSANTGRSRPRDYRAAYTDCSAAVVEAAYRKDVELLNYTFE